MYEQHLQAAGLSKDQAIIYEILVREGALPASTIARIARLPRTLSYAILQQLENLELVEKKKASGSVTTFSPAHPFNLQTLARTRVTEAQDASTAVDGALAALISQFNTTIGQPGIRILEGTQGLRDLYANVLRERQPILLIRSPNDNNFSEAKEILKKHIAEQARVGISVRAITRERPGTREEMLVVDKKRRMVRRTLHNFRPPAQVLIYGNKVAITSYNDQIISTIIENKDINQTFRLIFEVIWNAAKTS